MCTPVTVRVTDDGTSSLDDFETFNITVGEVNQAPVLAAIGNKNVNEGKPADLHGIGDRCGRCRPTTLTFSLADGTAAVCRLGRASIRLRGAVQLDA